MRCINGNKLPLGGTKMPIEWKVTDRTARKVNLSCIRTSKDGVEIDVTKSVSS